MFRFAFIMEFNDKKNIDESCFVVIIFEKVFF